MRLTYAEDYHLFNNLQCIQSHSVKSIRAVNIFDKSIGRTSFVNKI